MNTQEYTKAEITEMKLANPENARDALEENRKELRERIEVLTTEASFWKDIAMRAVPFIEDSMRNGGPGPWGESTDKARKLLSEIETMPVAAPQPTATEEGQE